MKISRTILNCILWVTWAPKNLARVLHRSEFKDVLHFDLLNPYLSHILAHMANDIHNPTLPIERTRPTLGPEITSVVKDWLFGNFQEIIQAVNLFGAFILHLLLWMRWLVAILTLLSKNISSQQSRPLRVVYLRCEPCVKRWTKWKMAKWQKQP